MIATVPQSASAFRFLAQPDTWFHAPLILSQTTSCNSDICLRSKVESELHEMVRDSNSRIQRLSPTGERSIHRVVRVHRSLEGSLFPSLVFLFFVSLRTQTYAAGEQSIPSEFGLPHANGISNPHPMNRAFSDSTCGAFGCVSPLLRALFLRQSFLAARLTTGRMRRRRFLPCLDCCQNN